VSIGGSFRARLLVGSLLWTIGVTLTCAAALVAFLATHPRPHEAVLEGFIAVPLGVSGAVGLACLAIGAAVIWRSVRAVHLLRDRLADVHRGATERLVGTYPAEVQALVDDLNVLLEARTARVERAAARAADLAHGLKTPLAVLAHDADRVAAHDAGLAASIAGQVARMARQIDYYTSQARVVAAGSATALHAPLAPAVDGLFRVLERLHTDRGLTFDHDIAPDDAVRCAPEDLDEMLGNLLDNAGKWGRSRVCVSSSRADDSITIAVDDDGEGLAPSLMTRVLQRGVRADQRMPGSGLGLAIVHDLVELYGGTLVLDRSPLGGLRVAVTLARAGAGSGPARRAAGT
jgi:signal transduction histidine kinase